MDFSLGIVDRLVGTPVTTTDRDARTVGLALLGALLLGFVLAISWQPKFWAPASMWASAAAICGMLLGFLFGIPRFLARSGAPAPPVPPVKKANQAGAGDAVPGGGDQPGTAVDETQAGAADSAKGGANAKPDTPGAGALGGVNTNLEEISDWLTKIIVGVSLVELRKARTELQAAAEFVAQSLGGSSQVSFAFALLIYFSIAGFLGSYLLTRLYLQKAFKHAAGEV